jgi:hypothetical protein
LVACNYKSNGVWESMILHSASAGVGRVEKPSTLPPKCWRQSRLEASEMGWRVEMKRYSSSLDENEEIDLFVERTVVHYHCS